MGEQKVVRTGSAMVSALAFAVLVGIGAFAVGYEAREAAWYAAASGLACALAPVAIILGLLVVGFGLMGVAKSVDWIRYRRFKRRQGAK